MMIREEHTIKTSSITRDNRHIMIRGEHTSKVSIITRQKTLARLVV